MVRSIRETGDISSFEVIIQRAIIMMTVRTKVLYSAWNFYTTHFRYNTVVMIIVIISLEFSVEAFPVFSAENIISTLSCISHKLLFLEHRFIINFP